jgi:hypothetical protein
LWYTLKAILHNPTGAQNSGEELRLNWVTFRALVGAPLVSYQRKGEKSVELRVRLRRKHVGYYRHAARWNQEVVWVPALRARGFYEQNSWYGRRQDL